jgi:hypothetical protein
VTSAGRTLDTWTERLQAGRAKKSATAAQRPNLAGACPTGFLTQRLDTGQEYRITGARQGRGLV